MLNCDAELAALAAVHLAGMPAYHEKEHWPIPSSTGLGRIRAPRLLLERPNSIAKGLSVDSEVSIEYMFIAL
jgi:hypothetical protein